MKDELVHWVSHQMGEHLGQGSGRKMSLLKQL
jgi:hypothetical protein